MCQSGQAAAAMLDPVVDVVEERGKNLEMATDAAGKSPHGASLRLSVRPSGA